MKRKREEGTLSDLALGKLSPEESLRLMEELEHDPEGSEELDFHVDLINFVAEHGAEVFDRAAIAPEACTHRPSALPKGTAAVLRGRQIVFRVAALAFLCVTVGCLALVSHLTKSKYYELAIVDETTYDMHVRAAQHDDVRAAQDLFVSGRYEESIRLLERFIRAYPESDLLVYIHRNVGAMYLYSAPRSILSLFPHYDRTAVLKGLGHIDASLDPSATGRQNEESYWLQAKGLLMLDRSAEAMQILERIKELNGRRGDQAEVLMKSIEGTK
jgi:tetratricopeptide (TPR) repeat protein